MRSTATLIPHYGADGAVAVVVRASWPEQVILRGTLSTIAAQVRDAAIERTALILVGPALSARDFADSALYSATMSAGSVPPPRPAVSVNKHAGTDHRRARQRQRQDHADACAARRAAPSRPDGATL